MSIEKLINKYYKNDGANNTGIPKRHKHEQTTASYDKKIKQENNLRLRQAILTELLNETPFQLKQFQVQQIRYWINQFNNEFKDFHRQASNETIILAFIMMQRKHVNSNLRVDRFTISRKYNLNCNNFITIQNNLIFKLMKTMPLLYNQKKNLDNFIENKKRL